MTHMSRLRRRYREDEKSREMQKRAGQLGITLTSQQAACLVHSNYEVKTDMLDADEIVEKIDSQTLAKLLFPN